MILFLKSCCKNKTNIHNCNIVAGFLENINVRLQSLNNRVDDRTLKKKE